MFEGDRKDHEEGGRDDKGLFLPGNKFWRSRKSHGPGLKFETPEDLQAACFEYFDWVDENPLWEMKVFGTGLQAKLPRPRAMTIRGLCGFIGLARRAWDNYHKSDGFKEVCEMAEDIMFDQKFAGAAAGLFNAAIIARDLGLADKREVDENLTVEVVDRFGEDNDPE